MIGDDIHESRFTFSVGPDQTDMFSPVQAKRNIFENAAIAETVAQLFNCQ